MNMFPSVLSIDTDYAGMEEGVEKVLETFSFPWSGKRVLIKPNMLGPYPPEKGITTHPSLIRALVKSLKRRQALCWVGDNPGLQGYAANARCARICGIEEAADGCFVNLARDTVQVDLPSRFLKKLVISKPILEADIIIDVPKFKTHVQTRITGAIKNMFGILPGAEKARVHCAVPRPQDFSEMLVDIYQIRPPDLILMDAVVGMEGNGPSGKDLRAIGKILGSPNGVAIDGLMAAMMGIPPEEVDHLKVAHQRNLGPLDPAEMEIQGDWVPLKKFKMPLTYASRGVFGTLVNKILYRPQAKPRLKVNTERCTQCQVCVQHCPAGALAMDGIPRLDEKKCISCYCCYELCSQQAIELTGLMRWITPRRCLGRTL
jgi:uncharacterized protein (DUF362 family)/NAD-dependent dihydropyrimidine dehydrogenase PreA subunit